MKNTETLEKRITELEYRISVLEKFLDVPSSLFHKNDESLMNSIRLEVMVKMKNDGLDVDKLKERSGTEFYQES